MNWREFPYVRIGVFVLLLGQAWNFAGSIVSGGGLENLGAAIGAAACVAVAGLLIAPLVRPLLTWPATRLVDLLYLGDSTPARPPQNLRLAHAYLAAERWEEAEAECERQLEWHKDSPELWACLAHAGEGKGNAAEAERVIKRARARLRGNPEALEKFERLLKAGPPQVATGKSHLWQH